MKIRHSRQIMTNNSISSVEFSKSVYSDWCMTLKRYLFELRNQTEKSQKFYKWNKSFTLAIF